MVDNGGNQIVSAVLIIIRLHTIFRIGWRYLCKTITMSVKPYPETEEGIGVAKAEEPVVHEVVAKRRVNLADVMKESITLEDFHKEMTQMIYRFYHPAE